jgi:FtsH-binding integral membrane protein
MNSEDFPALKRTADEASTSAQRQYLSFFSLSLILMVSGCLVSTMVSASQQSRTWGLIVGAVLVGVSVVFTLAIRVVAPERVWFAGRAVAESVKTITWRYVMCAEPFDLTVDGQIADERFLKELGAILREKKTLAWNLGGSIAEMPQITDKMREMRTLTLDARKEAYRDQRIGDQRKWYGRKAVQNRSAYLLIFWVVVSAQLCALCWAIVIASRIDMKLNLTAVFSAVAASLIAWSQVKRYQELAQAYALTAHELGIVQEKLIHVTTEDHFSSFVADAESAISREHTMWIARRDTP